MTVAEVVDVKVNPNNPDQRYVFYGNGRIDNEGGAPAIPDHPTFFDRIDQPVVVAGHVTDWTIGAGYALDYQGGLEAFGGAPVITSTSGDTVVNSNGLPYFDHRMYVDWSWNPDGSGQGVAIDIYGQLYPFGGAPTPPRTGPAYPYPAVKRMEASWSPTLKVVHLDMLGGLHTDYAATDDNTGPYWPGWDAARDFVVTSWGDPVAGQVMSQFGDMFPFGGAPQVFGNPYKVADVARKMAILSPADPLRVWEVWAQGQQFEWVSSTAPTVQAGGADPTTPSPAATVTTTTRPTQAWAYSDAQSDSQAAWEVMDFAQSFVDVHDMTDPHLWDADAVVNLSGTDRARRGVVADYDFPNGNWRQFVRAQDTSGLWSAWSNLGWTQNVALPVAPTGLTAIADEDNFSVALSVTATTGGSADLIRFECSDDGITWAPVPLADAVPLAATTTATDRSIPLGVTRTYRAIAYATNPRVASDPSTTAQATVTTVGYVLTVLDDSTLGGRITVQEPVEWTRTAVAGIFQGVGAEYPTVVSDGSPKAKKTTLHVVTLTESAWQAIQDVAESNSTLIYRDPYGRVMYCRIVGDWSATWLKGGGVGFRHTTDLPLIEIALPTSSVLVSTVPPGPGS